MHVISSMQRPVGQRGCRLRGLLPKERAVVRTHKSLSATRISYLIPCIGGTDRVIGNRREGGEDINNRQNLLESCAAPPSSRKKLGRRRRVSEFCGTQSDCALDFLYERRAHRPAHAQRRPAYLGRAGGKGAAPKWERDKGE